MDLVFFLGSLALHLVLVISSYCSFKLWFS